MFSRKWALYVAGIILLTLVPSARAQQTSTLSSLYLSSGSELDFGLYGAKGGAGTNGLNSDQIAVTNQFNFSSASSGSYIVGFAHDDTSALNPGSLFTLVSFGTTNFTTADATHFQAAPRDNIAGINGTFVLNIVSGGSGTLQFQLGSEADMAEPPPIVFLLAASTGAAGLLTQRRRRVRGTRRR